MHRTLRVPTPATQTERSRWFAALLGLAVVAVSGCGDNQAGDDEAAPVHLSPASMTAAEIGDYKVHIPLPDGLDSTSTIRVHFPKAWFPNPWPLTKPVQTADANAPHYLSVSSPDGRFELTWDYFAPTGERERFEHLIDLRSREPVPAGSSVTVSFASTTAPYIAGADVVRVSLEHEDGDVETWQAAYEVKAAPAESLHLTALSTVAVGEEVEIHATALDRFGNLATGYNQRATVDGIKQAAELAMRSGRGTWSWIPEKAGTYWPHLSAAGMTADGNPVLVTDEVPEERIYWGDLHSHSRISMDAVGFGDFAYARDVSRLDFYASTEHAEDDDYPPGTTRRGIRESEWRHIVDQVRQFNVANEFVTILAYECGLRGGHYNVYFRSLEGVPLPAHEVRDVSTLWRRLERGEAFTIPHHTGKRHAHVALDEVSEPGLQTLGEVLGPGGRHRGHDWTVVGSKHSLVPAIEIYSSHGSSERYDPDDPLSYESVQYSSAMSGQGPHYAQDAWAAGHHLGVVAASDNHIAHPGMAHRGLTAVRATELTRPEVFDALRSRHSWGTTGERIIVDLSWGEARMGDRVGADEVDGEVEVSVVAPRSIAYVELIGFRPQAGWDVVTRWDQPGRSLAASTADLAAEPGVVIYLRAELEGATGGRISRAWSSPIRVVD